MSIIETKRKIHFIPFTSSKGKKKSQFADSPTMTLSVKFKMLHFSNSLVNELDLEGKFIKLFFEPTKKIIGFQVRKSVNGDNLKDWKLVKRYAGRKGTIAAYKCAVGGIINEFNGTLHKDSYKELPVCRYVERQGLDAGNEYFYIQINDNPEELRKGLGNEEIGNSTSD